MSLLCGLYLIKMSWLDWWGFHTCTGTMNTSRQYPNVSVHLFYPPLIQTRGNNLSDKYNLSYNVIGPAHTSVTCDWRGMHKTSGATAHWNMTLALSEVPIIYLQFDLMSWNHWIWHILEYLFTIRGDKNQTSPRLKKEGIQGIFGKPSSCSRSVVARASCTNISKYAHFKCLTAISYHIRQLYVPCGWQYLLNALGCWLKKGIQFPKTVPHYWLLLASHGSNENRLKQRK